MAVDHIKFDQVDKQQAVEGFFQHLQRHLNALGIVERVVFAVDAAVDEDVVDLPHRPDIQPGVEELIEHGIGLGRAGVIAAVLGALEVFRIGAHKRPGDHPPHRVLAREDLAGFLADLVKFRDRDHIFMGRNLENAVSRGVDDRLAGAQVLLAQLLKDHGAGGRVIPQGAAADLFLKFIHDLGRKPVRISRRRFRQVNAHHLPMTLDGILAGREGLHLAITALGGIGWGHAFNRGHIADADRAHVGQADPAQHPGDVADRVGTHIAVIRGIRRFADAHPVQNNNRYSFKHKSSSF